MTDAPTHLTRLRTRLLATAYAHTDVQAQCAALRTDQALAALAHHDPAAAEDLAASTLTPDFLDDTRILGAAAQAGIDTSTWEERRTKARAYARDADELPSASDPETEAQRIWASLYGNYPPIAAALAAYLHALPTTWREDLFTTGPDSPTTRPAAAGLPGPETAPYDPLGWEDCPACAEAQEQCRYHHGVLAGMAYQRDLITTALTDDTAIDQLQQRHADLAAHPAQPAAAAAHTPTTLSPGTASGIRARPPRHPHHHLPEGPPVLRQSAATTETRPRIVVLCGSTRYWDALAEATLYETVAGRIVLAPGCNLRQPHPLWAAPDRAGRLKQQLDALHRRKIDLADEVLVVNPDGYIGDSTRGEIEYACSLGKPVRYTHAPDTIRYTADVVVMTPDGHVLLIERDWPPYVGAWALPGGHRDPGESSRKAASRELAEETGVRVATDNLRLIGTWDQPGRDPRGRYSTDAYLAIVPAGTQITAGSDARNARWWPLDSLPDHLAFDHADILNTAVASTT